jgi:hypothetical protein
VLFVATQDDLICAQATGALTAGPNNTYTPGSITFGGPLVRSTWALPSPYVSKVRLKAKHLIHGGIIGAPVDSVSTGALVVGYPQNRRSGADNVFCLQQWHCCDRFGGNGP